MILLYGGGMIHNGFDDATRSLCVDNNTRFGRKPLSIGCSSAVSQGQEDAGPLLKGGMHLKIGCRRAQSVLLPPVPAPSRHSNVRTTQELFFSECIPGRKFEGAWD